MSGALAAFAFGLAACGQLLDIPERRAVANVADCSPESGCACAPGFADCDGLLENGCEVDLLSGARCACEPRLWPQPPVGSDASSDPPIVFAMRSMTMEKGGAPVGYDLDQNCSCSDDPESPCPCAEHCDCEPVPNAQNCIPPLAKRPVCDGANGVDNASLRLIKAAGSFAGLSLESWEEKLEQGNWSVLLSVRDYNRQPNDAKVEVAFLFATEFDGDPCNGEGSKPKWDGTDRWPVRADGLEGTTSSPSAEACGDTLGLELDQPLYVDRNAYVVDGTLVAEWPEAVMLNFSGSIGGLRVELVQSVLTARIAQDGAPRPGESENTWRLRDAVLGGRWSQGAIFKAVGAIQQDSGQLCDQPAGILLAKSFVCPLLDVRVVPGGPTSTCDGMSFGFGFEAEQAELGSVTNAASGSSCDEAELEKVTCASN